MKRTNKILALAVVLTIALVPAAFAASMPDEVTKVSGAEDTTFTRSVVTPHDYLGEVSIGGLWLNGNEINTWKFGVFIVDDNAEIFETQGYLSKKLSNYILMNEDSALEGLYLENGKVNIDLGWDEYEGDCTKADPHIYRYAFQADAWMPQIDALYMYDTDYEYAGWFDWSVIIFTKSQLANFKNTGKLPPMTNMWGMAGENSVDFSSYVDLTELKALLSGASAPAPNPTPAPPTGTEATPYPNVGVTLDGVKIPVEVYSINGSTFLKLSDLAAAVGVHASWDGAVRLDTSKKPDAATPSAPSGNTGKVQATPYPNIKVTLDGKEIPVAVYGIAGSTFLSLKDVAAALGLKANWDGATSTAVLTR